ncbi:MAG: hypothetical protein M3R70_08955 [Actinomycetota bacterium]|nr:hypothetical protein [Actinomycetota bacterium]
MELFHYHLVTSKVREVEARYIGKLGFKLVARYGRIGDEQTYFEAGVPWEELDRLGFKLRLSELERGAVNVVAQPGQWEVPRIDHLGFALDDEEFHDVLERARDSELRIQEHGGRRTFVTTGAGYRLEVHPPRDWLQALLAGAKELRVGELQLRSSDPLGQAEALGQLLDLPVFDGVVRVGEATVTFMGDGPAGRPELDAELFA